MRISLALKFLGGHGLCLVVMFNGATPVWSQGPNPLEAEAKFEKERARFWQRGSGGTNAMAFSPNSLLLAASNGRREVVLWDVATNKLRHVLGKHARDVNQLAFSTDGKTLITACLRPKVETTKSESIITTWNVETGLEVENFRVAGNCYYGGLSEDGRILVVETDEGIVEARDLAAKRDVAKLTMGAPHIGKVVLSVDGKTVAVCGFRKIRVWELPSGKLKHEFEWTDEYASVDELAISRDGRFLAAKGEKKRSVYHFWDLNTGKPLGPPVKTWGFYGQFTPAGKQFVVTLASDSAGFERSWVDFWSVEKPAFQSRKMLEYFPVGILAFSPDGKLLARSGPDGTIQILDMPKLPKELEKEAKKKRLRRTRV
jgi:WD40 repeat protein